MYYKATRSISIPSEWDASPSLGYSPALNFWYPLTQLDGKKNTDQEHKPLAAAMAQTGTT